MLDDFVSQFEGRVRGRSQDFAQCSGEVTRGIGINEDEFGNSHKPCPRAMRLREERRASVRRQTDHSSPRERAWLVPLPPHNARCARSERAAKAPEKFGAKVYGTLRWPELLNYFQICEAGAYQTEYGNKGGQTTRFAYGCQQKNGKKIAKIGFPITAMISTGRPRQTARSAPLTHPLSLARLKKKKGPQRGKMHALIHDPAGAPKIHVSPHFGERTEAPNLFGRAQRQTIS